jgi:hypothetical protein
VSSNSSTSSACSASEISGLVVADIRTSRVPAGAIRRPAAAVGVIDSVPAAYQIPRLPAGEIRRRAIAVGERLLRADNHRRARPAIARGRKTCRVCKIECSSAVVYREHISGRRHKSILARQIAGVQRCDICELSIETKAQFETHLGGRRHRKAVLDKALCDDREATLALAELAVTAASTPSRNIAPRFRSAPLPR